MMIPKNDLENQWHSSSLERIFIENRIYRKIEDIETWEGVLKEISHGLKPYAGILKRDVSEEDIVKLTEIKIKRISKFDIEKAKERLKVLKDCKCDEFKDLELIIKTRGTKIY